MLLVAASTFIPHGPGSTLHGSAKMPNATSWREEEDVWLCTAYTNISEDGATGTDQDSSNMWERIHATYYVALWASLYSLVEAEERSGWTGDDCVREANDRFSAKREQQNANALDMYKKNPNSKKTKPRPKPDTFRLMHCYEVLKNSVRFMRASTPPRSRTLPHIANPSGSSGVFEAGAREFAMDNLLDSDDSEASEGESVGGRLDNQKQMPTRPKGKKQTKAANLEAAIDRSMAHTT
ncbi:hypothetical protein PR002_g5563 [Phytophthora rubi]|uniref:No apical meristem-associated C-terminal domain-containing protein n=1 Tax=Phytophthora rubi TaxID=129364 RepID=A0A6A3NBG7_9STRA|nr:hypothetical protein PR002_g5563 [Phytophthora rubi]